MNAKAKHFNIRTPIFLRACPVSNSTVVTDMKAPRNILPGAFAIHRICLTACAMSFDSTAHSMLHKSEYAETLKSALSAVYAKVINKAANRPCKL